jgi:hypothetical protein
MTARPAPMRRSLTDAVDQVVRKEQFLADHPGASILVDPDASPYERWRGHLPDCPAVMSHDLGWLLDRLDELVASRDALPLVATPHSLCLTPWRGLLKLGGRAISRMIRAA